MKQIQKHSDFYYFKRILVLLILCLFPVQKIFSQKNLDVGIRFQKTVNLYYENGFTLQYSDERLLNEQLYIGVSYVTSRLGSAMGSNALKQDNYLFSGTYLFRPSKTLQPFSRLNTGYFYADYEEDIFKDLPNSSFLLSPEFGISYNNFSPFKIGASIGYNLITGDGIEGPGTLFPVFFQTSLTWNILFKSSKE